MSPGPKSKGSLLRTKVPGIVNNYYYEGIIITNNRHDILLIILAFIKHYSCSSLENFYCYFYQATIAIYIDNLNLIIIYQHVP
jgi:formaldehyde-activating enzyme involved in methanogenesis